MVVLLARFSIEKEVKLLGKSIKVKECDKFIFQRKDSWYIAGFGSSKPTSRFSVSVPARLHICTVYMSLCAGLNVELKPLLGIICTDVLKTIFENSVKMVYEPST